MSTRVIPAALTPKTIPSGMLLLFVRRKCCITCAKSKSNASNANWKFTTWGGGGINVCLIILHFGCSHPLPCAWATLKLSELRQQATATPWIWHCLPKIAICFDHEYVKKTKCRWIYKQNSSFNLSQHEGIALRWRGPAQDIPGTCSMDTRALHTTPYHKAIEVLLGEKSFAISTVNFVIISFRTAQLLRATWERGICNNFNCKLCHN